MNISSAVLINAPHANQVACNWDDRAHCSHWTSNSFTCLISVCISVKIFLVFQTIHWAG